MARVYPTIGDRDTPDSERKVLARLRERLPDSWVVFHGRSIVQSRGRPRSREREVDFVVLDPARGYLVLEVKGGEVSCRDGKWRSRARNGATHDIKNPGAQAQDGAHALHKYLRGSARFRPSGASPAFGWGVVLPDVVVKANLGPGLPRDRILDRHDVEGLPGSIDRMFAQQEIGGPPLSPERVVAFIDAICPAVHLAPTLASRLEDDEPVLVRLTDEQMEVLDTLAEIPRLGVKGAAGTGKTLVAMERARRLADAGRRTLLLCFNRPLADHLAERARGFSVTTFHSLCREMALEAGLPFEIPAEAEAAREFWTSRAPELLLAALESGKRPLFDAVIVDEGQDFLEYWWVPVQRLLRDAREGVLWVFYDPHQNIYGGGPAEALGFRPALLKWNCRNTGRIAKYSSGFVGQRPELRPGTPEGVAVETIRCAEPKEMYGAVRRTLHRLLGADGLKPDRVVVLSPHGAAGSAVFRARTFGNYSLAEHPQPLRPNEVAFSSLQRFKGLEADAIILCEVDGASAACSPAHLYVGTSRARHALTVIRTA